MQFAIHSGIYSSKALILITFVEVSSWCSNAIYMSDLHGQTESWGWPDSYKQQHPRSLLLVACIWLMGVECGMVQFNFQF